MKRYKLDIGFKTPVPVRMLVDPNGEWIKYEDVVSIKEIFVLLSDGDGTMRSIDEPWGAAVTTEAEAKRYVEEAGIGYTHSYDKVKIFKTYKEGREEIYGKLHKPQTHRIR